MLFGWLMLAQAAERNECQVEILIDDELSLEFVHAGPLTSRPSKVVSMHSADKSVHVRVAVALSVDGLNTIDARHTDASSARKWVLGPYEAVTIRGWQTNSAQARRFFFTTEDESYGGWLGKKENLE